MARLHFQPPQDELGVRRVEADHNAVRHGTVQHELLEGRAAVAYAAGASLAIDVDCRIDAGTADAPVRFGLAVSLELAPTVQTDVYEEVRLALRERVRAQVTPPG